MSLESSSGVFQPLAASAPITNSLVGNMDKAGHLEMPPEHKSEGSLGKTLGIGVVSCVLGVIATVALVAGVVNRFPEVDSMLILAVPAFFPAIAFLAGLILAGYRKGHWPLPSRGPRLLAAFVAACLCGVAAYLSFVMVSFIWNADLLPLEKQSYAYLAFHPGEIPELTEVVKDYDRNSPPREFSVSWPPATILAFFLGGFIVFLWSGRWDKV